MENYAQIMNGLTDRAFSGKLIVDGQPTGAYLKYGPDRYMHIEGLSGDFPDSLEYKGGRIYGHMPDRKFGDLTDQPEYELFVLLDPRVVYAGLEQPQVLEERETGRTVVSGQYQTSKLASLVEVKDVGGFESELGTHRHVRLVFRAGRLETMRQDDIQPLRHVIEVRFGD